MTATIDSNTGVVRQALLGSNIGPQSEEEGRYFGNAGVVAMIPSLRLRVQDSVSMEQIPSIFQSHQCPQ